MAAAENVAPMLGDNSAMNSCSLQIKDQLMMIFNDGPCNIDSDQYNWHWMMAHDQNLYAAAPDHEYIVDDPHGSNANGASSSNGGILNHHSDPIFQLIGSNYICNDSDDRSSSMPSAMNPAANWDGDDDHLMSMIRHLLNPTATSILSSTDAQIKEAYSDGEGEEEELVIGGAAPQRLCRQSSCLSSITNDRQLIYNSSSASSSSSSSSSSSYTTTINPCNSCNNTIDHGTAEGVSVGSCAGDHRRELDAAGIVTRSPAVLQQQHYSFHYNNHGEQPINPQEFLDPREYSHAEGIFRCRGNIPRRRPPSPSAISSRAGAKSLLYSSAAAATSTAAMATSTATSTAAMATSTATSTVAMATSTAAMATSTAAMATSTATSTAAMMTMNMGRERIIASSATKRKLRRNRSLIHAQYSTPTTTLTASATSTATTTATSTNSTTTTTTTTRARSRRRKYPRSDRPKKRKASGSVSDRGHHADYDDDDDDDDDHDHHDGGGDDDDDGDDDGDGDCDNGSISRRKPPLVQLLPGVVHVRARRGEATDSHSLAERVRRERIGQRMKLLQDLVPGCYNKALGKAAMLEEIINYVKSLQNQIEFLSMKLSTTNPTKFFGGQLIIELPDEKTVPQLPHDPELPYAIGHGNGYVPF